MARLLEMPRRERRSPRRSHLPARDHLRKSTGADRQPRRAWIGESAIGDHGSEPTCRKCCPCQCNHVERLQCNRRAPGAAHHGCRSDAQPVQGAVGGSGLVFGLTPAEQTQLNNTMAANAGLEVFTVGATFANAQGGLDVIQAGILTPAIPEASTWAIIVLGFLGVGLVAYRRREQGLSFRVA
jgi:hypothetical protein